MKTIVPLFMAIVLGAVAVVGVNRYLQEQQKKLSRGTQPVTLLAAAKRIKAGSVITRAMLTTTQIEKRFVPSEAIDRANTSRLVGQTIRRNVDRGDVLLWSFFDPPEATRTRTLMSNERAVTIPVDNIRGVAGLIRPNSRIDIYGTFSLIETKNKQTATVRKTVMLLSDVTVLAIDNVTQSVLARASSRERRKQGYSSLTLAVSPQEAALLIFAQGAGELYCTLRDSATVGAIEEPIEVGLDTFLDLAKQANQKRVKKAPSATGIDEPIEP